jgi:hypothetical protein
MGTMETLKTEVYRGYDIHFHKSKPYGYIEASTICLSQRLLGTTKAGVFREMKKQINVKEQSRKR